MTSAEMNWPLLLDPWPTPIFILAAGRLLYQNQACRAILGRPAERLEELVHPDHHPSLALLSKVAGSGGEIVKLTLKLADGREALLTGASRSEAVQVLGELRPLAEAPVGEMDRLIGLIQSLRALGHDMCQPLTVILGQTEIMSLAKAKDPETTRRLAAILTEAEKLEAMTRRLSLMIHEGLKG